MSWSVMYLIPVLECTGFRFPTTASSLLLPVQVHPSPHLHTSQQDNPSSHQVSELTASRQSLSYPASCQTPALKSALVVLQRGVIAHSDSICVVHVPA